MIEYGMMFTAEQIQEIAWGVVGLVGMSFIVSLISSIRHGHALNWRDWRIGLGIPFVGIAIFGISTVNPTFGEASRSIRGADADLVIDHLLMSPLRKVEAARLTINKI